MNGRIPVFIVLLALSICLFAQENLNNGSNVLITKFRPGIRCAVSINYPVFHFTPTFSFYFSNHNVFLGVEISSMMGNYRNTDPRDTYILNNPGIKAGWRYLMGTYTKPKHFFLQLDASYYTGEFSFSSPGGGGGSINRIIEPGIAFGCNFRTSRFHEGFVGTGIAYQISDKGAFSHVLFKLFFGMAFYISKK